MSYPGYPSSGYPPNTGYPSASGGYPPANTGYPGGMPMPAPGFPNHAPASNTCPYPQASGGPMGYPYPNTSPAAPSAVHASPYPQVPSAGYPPVADYPQPYAQNNPYPQAQFAGHPQGGYPPTSGYPQSGCTLPTANPYSSPIGAPASSDYRSAPASQTYNPNPLGHSAISSSVQHSVHTQHAPPNMATLKPFPNFNAMDDANALRKAMKGFGTDEAAIINILCARSHDQRQALIPAYKQCHGRDLIKDLKSELSGNFENVIIGLMTPLDEYLAKEVKDACAGIGTDEETLIEVLCTRSNAEIQAIKAAYQRLYNESLESAIRGETSGDFRKVLTAMINAQRPEYPSVDVNRARQQAQELHKAGVKQWGTDEGTFIMVLCGNSINQLRATFAEYAKVAGHDIMDAIRSEMSGDFKEALLAIVKSIYNTPLYFAEKLQAAMKGMGTNDKALIRIIVCRCEIDLAAIRTEYQKTYGKPLEAAIKSETSGDYKKSLVKIVTGSQSAYN